ncbi:NF-kappa-B inhibitor zeta [Bombina bombina]|uniref:NF-kappa-B inhibitor zeta n=1 Tax=Bombina bombina TaxID=8345 RepID=UPI00235B1005|nr:NF-kappa-B inhibitor zeta [Bombina bombina]
MLVEQHIEEKLEMLDQELMMGSPMYLGYFYGDYSGSEGSESGSSPTYSTTTSSSGPCSPTSDNEQTLNLSQSSPRSNKARDYMGIKRQNKGKFQGVRVKNSVRELLMQRRSKTANRADAFEKLKTGMKCEQYTELKNILKCKKQITDCILEGTVERKTWSPQNSLFLTPPSTPKSVDNMEEMSINEMKMESNVDTLQTLINIKNESKPVSLNTVQVNWMTNLPQNDHSQEQHYQNVPIVGTFTSHQAIQTSHHFPSPPKSDHYPFPSQSPGISPHSNGDCIFSEQLTEYQPAMFSNQDLHSCAVSSYVSLLESTGASTETCATDLSSPAQTFSPNIRESNSVFGDPNMIQTSANVSAQLCVSVGNNSSIPQTVKTLFQWQIEQEQNKLGHLSPKQLLFKDADGDTWLHISVAQGRRALCYVLAREMAALNALDIKEHNNQSALQVAVAANQHLIVQDLISLGAQVNTTDCWGRTPLHVCAVKGYSQVVQAIQKGAALNNQYVDVNATNYEGLTALHCAVIAHNAVVQQLQNLHSSEREKLMPKNKAMVETVRTLLQMGASVEAKDRKSGRTALHLAAEEANLELLRIFLDLPNCLSFVNIKAFNGNTALHVAASLQYRISHLDAVRLLMRRGADPSVRNLENEQPVHLVPDGPLGEQIRRVLKGKTVQHRSY